MLQLYTYYNLNVLPCLDVQNASGPCFILYIYSHIGSHYADSLNIVFAVLSPFFFAIQSDSSVNVVRSKYSHYTNMYYVLPSALVSGAAKRIQNVPVVYSCALILHFSSGCVFY